jgi:hypothetical protein
VRTGVLIAAAEPLSIAELRSIPYGRLLDLAAQYGDHALRMAVAPEELDRTPGLALPRKTGNAKHPGRRGHSPEDLQTVVEAWSRARKTHPRAPMKETARSLNYSPAQARRLVRRVQAEGLSD